MTRDAIIRFARTFDPQPFHLDERAARASLLKGLSASGWHTCSVFMSALEEGFLAACQTPELFVIDEIKWLFPVRPGDRISGRVCARALDAAASLQGYGQVAFECAATNANGRRVMIWKGRLALPGYNIPDGAEWPVEAAPPTGGKRPGALTHFDGISVGDGVVLGTYHMTAEAIRSFLGDYRLTARAVGAGCPSPEAHRWHVASSFMGRLVRFYLREASARRARRLPVPELGPSPGIRHLRWHAPVAAGDTLTFRAWAERKSTLGAASNWGLLIGGCAGHNQTGQPVISFEAQLLLERRA